MMEEHFTVFDYARTQRRTYYHPPGSSKAATSLASSPATRLAANNHVTPPTQLDRMPSRPRTPGDGTGVASHTGNEIEAQIMEGGGLANVGKRAWSSQLDHGEDLDAVHPDNTARSTVVAP